MDVIREPSLPTLGRHAARLRRLRAIVRGAVPGLTVVDGEKLVLELADAGLTIHELYLASDRTEQIASNPALRAAAQTGKVWLLDPDTAVRIAPTRHGQGVLAVVSRPVAAIEPARVALFLDRVQEPGNVGAVIRTATAFNASGVACSPGCADPFSPKAIRASAGRCLFFSVVQDAAIGSLAALFRASGGRVVGASAAGGVPLSRYRPVFPLLVVLGNEGQGLLPEVECECSELVSIPLSGGVESLNVAVCCGVLLASIMGVVGSPILNENCGGGNDPSP